MHSWSKKSICCLLTISLVLIPIPEVSAHCIAGCPPPECDCREDALQAAEDALFNLRLDILKKKLEHHLALQELVNAEADFRVIKSKMNALIKTYKQQLALMVLALIAEEIAAAAMFAACGGAGLIFLLCPYAIVAWEKAHDAAHHHAELALEAAIEFKESLPEFEAAKQRVGTADANERRLWGELEALRALLPSYQASVQNAQTNLNLCQSCDIPACP